jgi:hypothetical protein
LHDELPVDQILQRCLTRLLELLLQLLALELRAQESFPRRGDPADLRVSNDLAIHNRGDAVDHARVVVLLPERTLGKRRSHERRRRQQSRR